MNILQRNARYLLLFVLGLIWLVQYMVTGVGNPHTGDSEAAASYEYVMVFSDEKKSKKLRAALKKRLQAAGLLIDEHTVLVTPAPSTKEQIEIARRDVLNQALSWNMNLKSSTSPGSFLHKVASYVEKQFHEEVKQVEEGDLVTPSAGDTVSKDNATGAEVAEAKEQQIFFHVSMHPIALMEEADTIGLPKKLKPEFVKEPTELTKKKITAMHPFEMWRKEEFESFEAGPLFFTSSERQKLIYSRMESAIAVKSTEDVALWEQEFNMTFHKGERIIPRLLHAAEVSKAQAHDDARALLKVFPVHDKRERSIVFTEFCSSKLYQPLSGVQMYFGVNTAWYFCWLGFYTRWLAAPSIVGILVTLFASGGTGSSPLSIYYAIFLCIWATVFLEFWKRHSSRMALQWNVTDVEKDEVQRPGFKGQIGISPITGKPCRMADKTRQRVLRYLVSPLVMLGMLTLAGIMMLCCFTLEDYIKANYPDNFWLPFVPIGLICLEIVVMNYLYSLVATMCNDAENHATNSVHEYQLVQKRILFEYVNAYGSLFYIAFIARDMDRLQTQLLGLLVTRQLFQNVTEAIVPWFLERFRAAKLVGKEASEVEVDMDATEDFYGDWAEMMLQYGYLLQFGAAFPLAAMFCMLNNVIELRSDAFKLFYTQQRPVARESSGIGIWYEILEFMSVMAVITNCGIIVFTSSQLEATLEYYLPLLNEYVAPSIGAENGIIMDNAWKLGLVLAFEHLILFFKWILACTINDVPQATRLVLKRQEYLEREAGAERQLLEKEARKLAYLESH